MIIPGRKYPGGKPPTAAEYNQIIDALEQNKFHAGRGIALYDGVGGRLISHKKDWFWGEIHNNALEIYHDESAGATAATIRTTTNSKIYLKITGGANAGEDYHDISSTITIAAIVTWINALNKGWVAILKTNTIALSSFLDWQREVSALGIANTQTLTFSPQNGICGIREQYVSNSTGDNTTATTFAEKTNGLNILATNTIDINRALKGYLLLGAIVLVDIVKSFKTIPPHIRYLFSQEWQISPFAVCGARVNNQSVWYYDKYGNQKWAFDTGSSGYAICYDSSENVYVGCANGTVYQVRKINSSGVQVWGFKHATSTASGRAICRDNSGNIFIGLWDGLLVKINSSGVQQWDYQCTGEIQGIAIDSNNNIYAAHDRGNGNQEGDNPDGDYRTLIKLNNAGTFMDSADTGDDLWCIAIDSSDNIIVGGYAVSTKSIWKLNSSLILQWSATTLDNPCMGVAADNIYVYEAGGRIFNTADGSIYDECFGGGGAAITIGSDGYIYLCSNAAFRFFLRNIEIYNPTTKNTVLRTSISSNNFMGIAAKAT